MSLFSREQCKLYLDYISFYEVNSKKSLLGDIKGKFQYGGCDEAAEAFFLASNNNETCVEWLERELQSDLDSGTYAGFTKGTFSRTILIHFEKWIKVSL